jgi:hypothetical protein
MKFVEYNFTESHHSSLLCPHSKYQITSLHCFGIAIKQRAKKIFSSFHVVLHSTKKFIMMKIVQFLKTLIYIVVGLQIKWCKDCSHSTSVSLDHVFITDCI